MKASDFPKARILNARDLARQIVEGNRNGRRYCFILGSGASVESGIPTGFQLEMAWMNYLMGQGKDKYDYHVKSAYGEQAEALLRSHTEEETARLANCLYEDVDEKGKRKLSHSFEEIKAAWTEALENKTGPWKYNFSEFYFDIYRLRFHDNDEDGYRYLERIMERCSPSIGYHPFSLLLANSDRNNLVVTTNFDTLAEDSLALYTKQKPLVISHESLAGFLSSELSRPMIAKVHRGLFFDPMNSPDLELAEEWKDKLNHLLAIYTPVVVGYGGGDHSLMSFLEECKSLKKLYWCVRGELEQTPERIVDAVASKKNGRFVSIKGFDALMLELGKAILGAECLTPTTVQAHFLEQMDGRISAYAKRWNELNGEQKPDLKEELTEIRAAEQREEAEREKEGRLTAWDYFQRGYAADESKQWDAAIEAYTKAIELQPDEPMAYNNRGNAYSDLGKYDEAIRDYARAIELQPDDPMAYNNRGIAYSDLGKYDEAIRDFDRAIELQPDDPMAYYNRGNTYDELGKYDEAIQDFDRAIELQTVYPEAYNNRGSAYDKLGKYDEAIRDFDRAIKLQPDYPKAYNNRGATYGKLRRYDEAIRDFDRAIKLQPDYPNAYNNRGNAYGELGKYDEAIRDYARAIELQPDFPEAYNNRGNAYCELGKYDEAIRDFDRAIELQPDLAMAYISRGSAYGELGKYDEAIRDYDRAIELQPDDPDAYFTRGIDYSKLGKYDEAIRDYDRAIELQPDDPDAYNGRGFCYAKMGAYEKALADIQHALELAPDDPFALHSLGFTYMKRGDAGDRERALELFNQAISIDPSLPDAYEDRAKLYREMGKPELAERDEAQARQLREKK